MKKRLITATAAGVLCLALSACTPAAEQQPAPSFTAVPTTSPTPQAGVDTPLATTIGGSAAWPVHISVYDVQAWEAEKGCDCSAPGDAATELYPAGSTAWAIRVDLQTASTHVDEGIDMPEVTFTSSWGPGTPVPVEVTEAESLADTLDLGWEFASVQEPALFPWGQTRSFLMSVYVPRGAVSLELELTVPATSTERNQDSLTYGLDVDLPASVIDLMYANSNGD